MNLMSRGIGVVLVLVASCVFLGGAKCNREEGSDDVQREQQEKILSEGTASIGMPAIKNFREKRIMKDILELRDQDGLITYTYVFNEHTSDLRFVGESVGYAIPAATQFTNPQKIDNYGNMVAEGRVAIPQADPNGLFSPAAAEGSWVLMKDPKGGKVLPVYFEPRIVVSPFRLTQ